MKKFIATLLLGLFLAVNAGAKDEAPEIKQTISTEQSAGKIKYYPIPDCIIFFGYVFC
jgi:hypothetical protein